MLAATGCAVTAPLSAAGEKVPRYQNQYGDESGFGQETAGFANCQLGDLYLDEYSGTTRSRYLQSLAGKRCDREDTLAQFCIAERFNGLKVIRLAVPKTTTPIFALYLDADLETARATLKQTLGSEFHASPASAQGKVPELIQDPENDRASILICTKQF
ncbi:hypothetical protein [Stenotrophomonas sp. MMGLT7]|uniref:hypothetical protein n=1 Tax=Stenotrophomonas sp. MMGLT7 TaxID=2901227 RepID=UPI001E515C33|nr:hypothetical protein [Stenotrophomonas sp. MMGLT7]MCD7099401.1 hypothetical protein [Stenotrophomonas sp. MMGLT7]